jgi:hypothetical protein
MIDYTYDFLIPANTSQSDAVTADIKLGKGRLENVHINFAEGCGTMVHVCIENRGFQFAPIIPNQSYHLDNYVINVDTEQDLLYEPFEVTLRGWSTGTKYDHTISFVFSVAPTDDNDALAELRNLLAVKHA